MTYIAAMWARTTKVCHLSPKVAQPLSPASGCPSVVPPFRGRKAVGGERGRETLGFVSDREKERDREKEIEGKAREMKKGEDRENVPVQPRRSVASRQRPYG